MSEPKRYTAVFLIVLVVVLVSAKWYWNQRAKDLPVPGLKKEAAKTAEELPVGPPERPPAAPEVETNVGGLGQLRVSDDASSKRGDFWLEQALELPPLLSHGPIADLYVSIDPATASGVRLRVTDQEAVLERVPPSESGKTEPACEALARATVAQQLAESAKGGGEHVLGALWRSGELSIWLDGARLFEWKGEAKLNGPSGASVANKGVKAGARRAMALGQVAFRDSFMRDKAGYTWRPARGKWELTQMAFPERSANPFSLRASFGNQAPAADKLYQGRLRAERYGIGVMIGDMEGTIHIVRITGGSPAARSGLQEDDTIVEVEGEAVEQIDRMRLNQYLYTNEGGRGGALHLKILRPGEKSLREFVIARDQFVWGTPMTGALIQPVSESPDALILGGEPGWSDYAAEVCVKALGSGSCGLAVAVTSPRDYLLLRWIGPPPWSGGAAGEAAPQQDDDPPAEAGDEKKPAAAKGASASRERLQLVRVEGGVEKVLAEKPVAYRPYEFYRMAIDWNGGEVRALVDGTEVFKENVEGLRRGQVGLYAAKGDPVFFDDVAVFSDRKELGGTARPERRINEIFAAEQDMERWANPALEWIRDEKTGWAVHTAPFPGEQAVVLNRPKFDDLEIALCNRGVTPPKDGVRIGFTGRIVSLLDEGQKGKLAQELPLGPYQRIAVRVTQKEVSLDVDGKAISWPRESNQANRDGTRIAIRGLKNLGDPKTVRATSSGVFEYTFDSAPADWKVESGRWGLLNKWICDPRWSWFGGRSNAVAAIWNKQVFSGDVTVDAHVAVMMERDDPPYERAGDYNLTLCGDGVHLDSGYTVIFGGGRNYWTRLYRNGKQVAEATDEKYRLPSDRIRQPDKPELHQRWFSLRLEKEGNKVSFYRDGEKAFTFTDPEPLGEGRVAFWTVDNGVLLSRCRIACGAAKPGPLESRGSELFDDGTVINMYDGEVHTRVDLEALPPEIAASVGAAPARFTPAESAPMKIEPRPEMAKGWRVTNATGGGPFALQWKNHRADPAVAGVVRFAMRLEPGASVDFYLKDLKTGELFRWLISGPKEWDEGLPVVGTLPIPVDGKWHSVQVDLGPSWAALWKRRGYDRPPRPNLRPMFGCLDVHAYAVAGLGVNRLGASYAVSDLMFLKPEDVDFTPPKLAKIVWPFDADGDGRRLKLVFDDAGGSGIDPTTLRLTLSGTSVPQELLKFDAASQTAALDLVAWRAGKALEENQTIALTLEKFADRAGNPALPPPASTLVFKVAEAAAAKKPCDPPVLDVLMDADRGVNAQGLRYMRPPGAIGREDVWPAANVFDGMVFESVAAPPWALEKKSVAAASLHDGSHFGFRLRGAQYDLMNWPYLAIEYKIPFEVPVNLHFNDAYNERMARQTLLLTDLGEGEDARGGRFGGWGEMSGGFHEPPAGFVADGTWRRVEVPILKMLASKSPGQASYEISNLDFREGGYRGNRRGMSYYIHKVQAVPAARSRGIAFRWTPRTLAGVSEYATVLDDKPDTVPPEDRKDVHPLETIEGAARRLLAEAGKDVPAAQVGVYFVSDGWKYLHLRVKNTAGVWSEPLHYKFRIDNTPPRVVKTEPAEGAKFAGKTIRIHLAEDHVVLASSLKLSINGQTVTTADQGVSFDGERNILTYDDTRAVRPVRWPNGTQVKVELQSAADNLGNELAEPAVFTFNADREADTKGPEIVKVRYCSPDNGIGESLYRPAQLEISMALNFEDTLGHVRALQDCRLDWTDDPKMAAFGRRSVRFVMQEDDCDAHILLHKNAWYMDLYPVLHFDYKADPGVNVDLQALVLGNWYTIKFLGDGKPGPEGGTSAGAIQTVRPGGVWRHASINLRQCIESAAAQLPVRIISELRLSTHGQAGAKRCASLWLDNLHLTPEAGNGGKIEWEAEEDESGIWGYSVIVDKDPDTEAPKSISTIEPTRAEFGRSGTWYVHARACDQAGNWGPTRHYRIDF
ncbi:MAG: PDZ domain-containing protein [Planctomycetes bacterium]|nr:PDZ domain-containing protein [Planctomycetota bacterium]